MDLSAYPSIVARAWKFKNTLDYVLEAEKNIFNLFIRYYFKTTLEEEEVFKNVSNKPILPEASLWLLLTGEIPTGEEVYSVPLPPFPPSP